MSIFRNLAVRQNCIVTDYAKLANLVEAFRGLGLTTVVTLGTYDGVHIGHSRYLEAASKRGDILVVGVDSDRAVKIYKDETRPIVPQDERLEMLLHLGYPDFVTIVDDVDKNGRWQYGLIEALRPDVFVAVEGSYPEEQLVRIRELCGEVIVLPRQAETSSSEKIRQAMIAHSKPLAEQLRILAEQIENGQVG